jgi:hypothetical protein
LFRKRRRRQAPNGGSHAAPASSAARAADWLSGSVPLTRAHKDFPAREARRLPCSSQPLTFTKTSSNASVKVTVTAERPQCCHEAQMIEVRSSTQRTQCLQRPNSPTVTAKMNGREATATLGPSARRFLCGWRRGKEETAVLVALALLGAQAPAGAATRNLQPIAGSFVWRLAQAASDSQPNAGAPTPRDDDKNKAEKAGVPATVVDGEQLESVLGIEALGSTGDDMGRIVDIIVDRSGQIRAAIIDFGGFLGVGSRKIAVDWRSLHFDPKKAGSVVVNLTKDQLRVAPVYKAAEPVVMIGGPDAKP